MYNTTVYHRRQSLAAPCARPALHGKAAVHLGDKQKNQPLFGLELPHWQAQLRAFLAEYLGAPAP